MHLLILGATGRVGSHITALALKGGHHVTALVRTPERIQVHDENLKIIQGNVLVQADIDCAIPGTDIVISALNTDETTTLSGSIPLIIEAMYHENIRRIITIGTAGILQSRVSPNMLRYQSSESRRKSTRAAEEHHRVYSLLKPSALEWTIVCPTYLPYGEYTGNYRVERDYLPEGGTQISVMDTAEFAYHQMQDSQYIKCRVGISY
ncbi:SDR family oxidoreductase [Paenibacillus sp. MMS20-IR301]|uniref:NAD(P)-dependent oxidoreductase n=1 Tax=Paenibacillus sp. MMS20-IR301 TaxID=2895946 RepID=UPI0028E2D07C|nr:SDR family oxidoreductase [Paenibacillus sp. MMS20-IR301]WNS45205.1 SDR family oxidoreductase [Paenibacillus sp. MMS20-IR301]